MYEVEVIQRKVSQYGEHDESVVGTFYSLREAISFAQMVAENFEAGATKVSIMKKEEKANGVAVSA